MPFFITYILKIKDKYKIQNLFFLIYYHIIIAILFTTINRITLKKFKQISYSHNLLLYQNYG